MSTLLVMWPQDREDDVEKRNVYDEAWCNPLSMNRVIILPRSSFVLLMPHTHRFHIDGCYCRDVPL